MFFWINILLFISSSGCQQLCVVIASSESLPLNIPLTSAPSGLYVWIIINSFSICFVSSCFPLYRSHAAELPRIWCPVSYNLYGISTMNLYSVCCFLLTVLGIITTWNIERHFSLVFSSLPTMTITFTFSVVLQDLL